MKVDKKTLEKNLVQARRIAEHREAGAEKEIRKIYKQLLKDLQQFVGYEYATLSENGKLTYDIMQRKGEYARFLEEVENIINANTPAVSKKVQELVEDTYKLCYSEMVEGVEKSASVEELQDAFRSVEAITAETVKKAVENPVSGLTLKDTLERNRKEIIYNIKRDIAVGMANGDRVNTMAKRIAGSVDNDYKKAVRIARTESHRIREAGFHDAALEIQNTLTGGISGAVLVKIWHTMKDERVRPNSRRKTKSGWKTYKGNANHQIMEGVTVRVDELFTLSDGSKTTAPSQSGVASQDIGCRCYLSYDLLSVDEYHAMKAKKA